jgi:hypothetical protein
MPKYLTVETETDDAAELYEILQSYAGYGYRSQTIDKRRICAHNWWGNRCLPIEKYRIVFKMAD